MNNSVKKCCICNNEKIGEFITINDNKYHLCCIEKLQQENNQLKDYIKELEENSGVLVSQVESWHKTADIYLEKSIRLQQESKELHNKIDKVIKIMEDYTLFSLSAEKVMKIINILKDSDVDE